MPNPRAIIDTTMGAITVELYADKTPQTVKNFGELAKAGYYDGTKFHRVIEGFMIQGGDPHTKDDKKKALWGTGGPGHTIIDEFPVVGGKVSDTLPTTSGLQLRFTKSGLLAMANTGRARSGGSQFFITLAATSHLDGRHTIFGGVVDGQKVVDAVGGIDTDAQDRPVSPIVVRSIKVEGELPGVELKKFPGK